MESANSASVGLNLSLTIPATSKRNKSGGAVPVREYRTATWVQSSYRTGTRGRFSNNRDMPLVVAIPLLGCGATIDWSTFNCAMGWDKKIKKDTSPEWDRQWQLQIVAYFLWKYAELIGVVFCASKLRDAWRPKRTAIAYPVLPFPGAEAIFWPVWLGTRVWYPKNSGNLPYYQIINEWNNRPVRQRSVKSDRLMGLQLPVREIQQIRMGWS